MRRYSRPSGASELKSDPQLREDMLKATLVAYTISEQVEPKVAMT
jgi:hypothetical protein